MGKKHLKKLVVLLLAAMLVIGSAVSASAATTSPDGGDTTAAATITRESTSVSNANKSIKVSYAGLNAVQYRIAYQKVGGGPWTYITTNDTSYTITGLEAGASYRIKVAGINEAGKRGEYTEIVRRSITLTASQKASSNSTGSFTINWNKYAKAAGYQIRYSTSSDMSNAKYVIKGGKNSTSRTFNGLKKGTYYVQVRPYKNIGGEKYFGAFSGVQKVTVK